MVMVRDDRLSGQMNSLVIFSRHEGLLTADGVRKEKPAVLCFPRKEAWEGRNMETASMSSCSLRECQALEERR